MWLEAILGPAWFLDRRLSVYSHIWGCVCLFSGALIFMTILSAAIGNVLPNLLPRKYTHYASAVRALLLLSQRVTYRERVTQGCPR